MKFFFLDISENCILWTTKDDFEERKPVTQLFLFLLIQNEQNVFLIKMIFDDQWNQKKRQKNLFFYLSCTNCFFIFKRKFSLRKFKNFLKFLYKVIYTNLIWSVKRFCDQILLNIFRCWIFKIFERESK